METVITKRVEDMLPAGLGAEYARCRAEALRNRRHQEGDPAEAPSPRRTIRREQALALQRDYEARQKELQQAASQQYRENRRFRAARVREERERIVSGGCADDVVEETAQNYQTKLADQYRENRAKARSYERRAREDLEGGPCVDLRGAARGAANLEKRMREKAAKESKDRDLRDALSEEAARYQAEARHAKQAVALDFTEAPRRKPPRRLLRSIPPPEEGAD